MVSSLNPFFIDFSESPDYDDVSEEQRNIVLFVLAISLFHELGGHALWSWRAAHTRDAPRERDINEPYVDMSDPSRKKAKSWGFMPSAVTFNQLALEQAIPWVWECGIDGQVLTLVRKTVESTQRKYEVFPISETELFFDHRN
jgi:hypothetical protein